MIRLLRIIYENCGKWLVILRLRLIAEMLEGPYFIRRYTHYRASMKVVTALMEGVKERPLVNYLVHNML